jgi:hypothetical protein
MPSLPQPHDFLALILSHPSKHKYSPRSPTLGRLGAVFTCAPPGNARGRRESEARAATGSARRWPVVSIWGKHGDLSSRGTYWAEGRPAPSSSAHIGRSSCAPPPCTCALAGGEIIARTLGRPGRRRSAESRTRACSPVLVLYAALWPCARTVPPIHCSPRVLPPTPKMMRTSL